MRLKRQLTFVLSLALTAQADAFCGFFVARGDAKIFNRSNQVIIARDGKRSVFTMMNDYQGDVKDFVRLVPIPVVPRREDIRIGDPSVVDRLGTYSAPRLVEYYDEDPCNPPPPVAQTTATSGVVEDAAPTARAQALGVKIEAQYRVGEYDILILSARQQSGLATFLRQEGYRLPQAADAMLGSYIRSGMKFFLIKVNLERFDREAGGFLRPVVLSYTSERFMLPIRLGTLNSPGEQDLTVYLLSRRGRVETSNYRTAVIPTGQEVPLLVKDNFATFYRHVFRRAYEREGKSVALLEYAWNSRWCDPCAGTPPSDEDLKEAGAGWAGQGDVFLTRLHVRYTAKTFPQDLQFKETNNRDTFQGRYVLRHTYQGPAKCEAAQRYLGTLKQRGEQQAQNLAWLTGWDVNHIRDRMRGEE